MNRITARFAILMNHADADGLPYCKDIGHVATHEAASILQGRFAQRYGGYVFIVNGRVWNSYDQERFDPEHIAFPVDSLSFSRLMADDLVAQIDERPSISCAMSEVTSLHVEFASSTDVTLTGVDHEGRVIYPSETVRLDCLLRGLLRAVGDFLRVAEERFSRDAAEPQADEPSDRRRANREFLDHWRGTAERLGALSRRKEGEPHPRSDRGPRKR